MRPKFTSGSPFKRCTCAGGSESVAEARAERDASGCGCLLDRAAVDALLALEGGGRAGQAIQPGQGFLDFVRLKAHGRQFASQLGMIQAVGHAPAAHPAGAEAGSKLDKAQALGLKILDEEGLNQILSAGTKPDLT